MADMNELVGIMTNSIYTPLLESDPAYIALQGRVQVYVDLAIKSTGYTVETLPREMEYYVTLLTLKQLFRVLAVARAPEYNVESEFTKIAKGDRFKHYTELITGIQKEIDTLTSNGMIGGAVVVSEVVLGSRDGTVRNYNLSSSQTATLTLGNITASTAELTWTLFNLDMGRFSAYEVLISTEVLYDDFEDEPIKYSNALEVKTFTDYKRNKVRFSSLNTATTYNIAVVFKGCNGSKDVFTTSFTTL